MKLWRQNKIVKLRILLIIDNIVHYKYIGESALIETPLKCLRNNT